MNCAVCGDLLEARTAGVTDRGLACQRCVLASLREDAEQMNAAEPIEPRAPKSPWVRAITGAVPPLAERPAPPQPEALPESPQWVGDDLLILPAVGGVRVVELDDDGVSSGYVAGRAAMDAIAPGAWRARASGVRRVRWREVTELVISAEDFFELRSSGETLRLAHGGVWDASRLVAAFEQRLPGWVWSTRPVSTAHVLSTSGCAGATIVTLAAVVGLLGAWIGGWIADLLGFGDTGRLVCVWLVPVSTVAVAALFLTGLVVMTGKDLRSRPRDRHLRPDRPAAGVYR